MDTRRMVVVVAAADWADSFAYEILSSMKYAIILMCLIISYVSIG